MRLMLDLIVLAFQMDKTRVATLMLNNDLSQMNFKFVEGVQGALHLDLTHNGRVAEKEAMYLKTNQFHIAQFAYLTERMKSISEGETTLLDNSILMARRACSTATSTAPSSSRSSSPAGAAAPSGAAASSTTWTRGTRTARPAASTSRSWTGWA